MSNQPDRPGADTAPTRTLPYVGAQCEYRDRHNKWVRAEVRSIEGSQVTLYIVDWNYEEVMTRSEAASRLYPDGTHDGVLSVPSWESEVFAIDLEDAGDEGAECMTAMLNFENGAVWEGLDIPTVRRMKLQVNEVLRQVRAAAAAGGAAASAGKPDEEPEGPPAEGGHTSAGSGAAAAGAVAAGAGDDGTGAGSGSGSGGGATSSDDVPSCIAECRKDSKGKPITFPTSLAGVALMQARLHSLDVDRAHERRPEVTALHWEITRLMERIDLILIELLRMPGPFPGIAARMLREQLFSGHLCHFWLVHGAVHPGTEQARLGGGRWGVIPTGGASHYYMHGLNWFGDMGGLEAILDRVRRRGPEKISLSELCMLGDTLSVSRYCWNKSAVAYPRRLHAAVAERLASMSPMERAELDKIGGGTMRATLMTSFTQFVLQAQASRGASVRAADERAWKMRLDRAAAGLDYEKDDPETVAADEEWLDEAFAAERVDPKGDDPCPEGEMPTESEGASSGDKAPAASPSDAAAAADADKDTAAAPRAAASAPPAPPAPSSSVGGSDPSVTAADGDGAHGWSCATCTFFMDEDKIPGALFCAMCGTRKPDH